MHRRFVITDVFTDVAFGGNQLAVVPDRSGLDTESMQALAREFNFAETTFVGPPERSGSLASVRIFTPASELPFAGHPTVGTASVLVHLGLAEAGRFVLDEAVGPVGVTVSGPSGGGGYRAELALAPDLRIVDSPVTPGAAAAALGVDAGDVLEVWEAGVGVPFTFVRLSGPGVVDAAVPDRAGVMALGGPSEVYGFAGEIVDGAHLHARMWAPGLGIEEDPATGSAAAALVGCVAARSGRADTTVAITIDQGVALGRPSRLDASATVTEGVVAEVRVGGGVVIVAEGTVMVP